MDLEGGGVGTDGMAMLGGFCRLGVDYASGVTATQGVIGFVCVSGPLPQRVFGSI